MGVGGLNACPLALGGDAETGWTAEQQDRTCADLLAITRCAPFAVVTVNVTASGATVENYLGMNGSGTDHAPAAVRTLTGVTTLTWSASYKDDYGVSRPVHIRFGTVTPHRTSDALGSVMNDIGTGPPEGNIVVVKTFDPSVSGTIDVRYTAVLW